VRGCFTALRFGQHDKLEMANLTLWSLSLQKEWDVCASRQGEVNPAWMLHCADAPVSMTRRCHSERSEESSCGCFASLSMTKRRMRFVQQDRGSPAERSCLVIT
jgi:hypothetical protein